jgi:hypothetical protein
MKESNDKNLEFFKKLHEVSGEIVKAYEKIETDQVEDTKELESAMGRFVMLMIEAQALSK